MALQLAAPKTSSDVAPATRAADLRGADVYDPEGMKVGAIDELLSDHPNDDPQFLLVSVDDVLGSKGRRLVPVDAIDRVHGGVVFLEQPLLRVARAPGYDPERVDDPAYRAELDGWYGKPPDGGEAG